jgi:hypothetical protein
LEGTVSEESFLLSYTLRNVSLTEFGRDCQFGFREPIHLCTFVREEGGDREGTVSEAPFLLSCLLTFKTDKWSYTLTLVHPHEETDISPTYSLFIMNR